jgi:hypothetical protein
MPRPFPTLRHRRAALLGALCLVPACGDDPTSPIGRDLAALCAGRRVDLAVRLVVGSASNLTFAAGDTLRVTLRFERDPETGGSSLQCPATGSVRLVEAPASLAWPADSASIGYYGTDSYGPTSIAIVGTGAGRIMTMLLPVRDSVGSWEYYVPGANAGAQGGARYRPAPAR